MLRFGSPVTERKSGRGLRDRSRVWLLFAAACVVLFGIRLLREPETAQRIDSLFLPEPAVTAPTIDQVLGGKPGDVEIGTTALSDDAPAADRSNTGQARFDLSVVRDNTYFRPEENAAWFEVFAWLANGLPGDRESIAEVSYAQFIDQPEVYRGQLVNVRGTVEREESLVAPANDLGIERYHRLVLRPTGGGVWPIVVYSLELPARFPRGEEANSEVAITGVFFKNWSYSWQGGLGLAPVVLAKTFEWHPFVSTTRTRTRISVAAVTTAAAAAGVLALLVGCLAWRKTRLPANVRSDHSVVIGPPPEEN